MNPINIGTAAARSRAAHGALLLLLAISACANAHESHFARHSTSALPPVTKDEPLILGARIAELAGGVRFTIEASDPLPIRVFTLADPDRVVVDMPEVVWRLAEADRPGVRGAIKAYRYGLFRRGNSRLVLDLARPVSVAQPVVVPPSGGRGYLTILDLSPVPQQQFAKSAGWPATIETPEVGARASPDARPDENRTSQVTRVIALDAGHGGVDTGTTGVSGATEKELVLDEVLRLRGVLRSHGYRVLLTRDSDVYVPLGQRVAAARSASADLFISLHADSNPNPKVFGASVYTLSEAGSDREAAALARKENQSDIIAGVDLSAESGPVASILIDLAQRDTMNRSARLAENLVSELQSTTDMLPRDPHRSAGFVVLKSPDVPAVLIELGYLSNPRDCAQMQTVAWRDRVAEAIAEAVDRQFEAASVAAGAAEAAK